MGRGGAFCVMQGGVLHSYALNGIGGFGQHPPKGELSFVQISDSHMGFNKPANPDVAVTLQAAIDKINALPTTPTLLLHTGDISHLSKPSEFDMVDQMLKSAKVKDAFFVSGEHDVLNDEGKQYRKRYAKGTRRRMVQLRQERPALHWAGQRDELEGRGTRKPR